MTAKNKTYRVFVTRHYIAVEFFDIKTTSPHRAAELAKKAAYKISNDPRADARDNGWLADNPIELEHGPGSYPDGSKVPLRSVLPGVFQFKASGQRQNRR